jgi:hypothetical protein
LSAQRTTPTAWLSSLAPLSCPGGCLLPPTTGASRKIARRRIRHANGPGAFGAPPRPISSMSPQHAAELAA